MRGPGRRILGIWISRGVLPDLGGFFMYVLTAKDTSADYQDRVRQCRLGLLVVRHVSISTLNSVMIQVDKYRSPTPFKSLLPVLKSFVRPSPGGQPVKRHDSDVGLCP